MFKALVCLAVLLVYACATARAQGSRVPDARNASATAGGPPSDGQVEPPPSISLGNRRIYFGVDVSFGLVHDDTLIETMGRERQIKAAFVNLTMAGKVNDHMSYMVVINPANDGPSPRPYIPSAGDRRTYFFPNQPEGRGVVSDPEGLYKVDDYKYSGFDPILQQGILRIAYLDVHSGIGTSGRQFGALIGRSYVPQGFGVNDISWYTAKDLTHIQRIDFQADNGLFMYYTGRGFRLDVATITGNGSPYHDYGYFDFTDASEDRNSAVGFVASGRLTNKLYTVGASYRKNYINSRIEDSVSLQLSKHNDDALIASISVTPVDMIRVYGEYARYTWGLATTSAELLPGPAVESPVTKAGYYVGVDLMSPKTPLGKWKGSFVREELSRDDALVSWAAANGMFGVTLGKRERTTIVKVETELMGKLACYGFWGSESNPFPELSALKPISGAGSDVIPGGKRYGFGIRFKM
jgi:hypothetical protein